MSQTRSNLTKFDHTKSIQTNLNQTKLKQTKQHHTNVTEIQASPSHQPRFDGMSCPVNIRSPQVQIQTHKLDQTKVNINGFNG